MNLNSTLARRLPRTIILPALGVALLVAAVAAFRASGALERSAMDLLDATRESRQDQLVRLFDSLEREMRLGARNPLVPYALQRLGGEFQRMPDAGTRLGGLYVERNPHPLGERLKLDDAGDGSAYSALHRGMHPTLRDLCLLGGYYDLFLIDPAGNVVFTVYKESDFATNLQHGPWKDSGLARVYRDVLRNPVGDSIRFANYEPYAPSSGVPAAFLATAVHDPDTKALLGILAIQLPSDMIAAILQDTTGLGNTGETFLVGADHLWHSDSRFTKENDILVRPGRSESVDLALAGGQGVQRTRSGDGRKVICSYGPMDFHGSRWAVLAEQEWSEVARPVHFLMLQILLILALAGALVAWLGARLARGVTDPVRSLTEAMATMAQGRLDLTVPGHGRPDELGDMARAVEVLRSHGLEVRRLEAEQRARDAREAEESARRRRAEEEREEKERSETRRREEAERVRQAAERGERRRMEQEAVRRERIQLAESFQARVGKVVEAVHASAQDLESTAQSMAALSEETSAQATSVAAAADISSGNLGSVAAAAEEMTRSIEEINRQIRSSQEIAGQAIAQSQVVDRNVETLTRSVDRIGEVVGMIRSVANQTNLLSLNASIEAARATEDIQRQIEAIQEDTREAAASIHEISSVVQRNGEIVTRIATAMDEQGHTTRDIARNVEEASSGTRTVSGNVQSLNAASEETSAASNEVLGSAQELGRQAGLLDQELRGFLARIRQDQVEAAER